MGRLTRRQAHGTAADDFAFPENACYPPAAAMRLGTFLLIAALAVAFTACAPSISGINARPAKYYQHKVPFTGRIRRMPFLAHETLLELADSPGGRIAVRPTEPL